MTLFEYSILTDPAPLQVSEAGGVSKGTVYIVVSNPQDNPVCWTSIEVTVPFGQQAESLTPDPTAIKARILPDTTRTSNEEPLVNWDPTAGCCTLSPQPAPPLFPSAPSQGSTPFKRGGAVILALEDFKVSDKPGPVLLHVKETVQKAPNQETSHVMLSLLKQAPSAPRNFRPKQSLVAAGNQVVLQWEGSPAFTYRIYGPDGRLSKAAPKKTPTGWTWSPAAGEVPKRDATYTLTATSAPRQQRPEHTLTTTVHLSDPEFDSVTATNGLHTPWVEGTTAKGQITFTAQGAQINNNAGTPGTIAADKADITSVVTTATVRGRGSGDGWIQFPSTGIKVGQGTGSNLGTVTADKADVNGVNTAWVQGRNTNDGWIAFPQTGVQVYKDGKREWGTLEADRTDVNGVTTAWVQGRGGSAGWIEFPPAGLNVFQGTGSRQWGTVTADKADLNDLDTRRALVKDRLTLQGGLTVDNVLETQDGPPRLIVHGKLDAESEVNAAGNVVAGGNLSVNGRVDTGGELHAAGTAVVGGDLNVSGQSTFSGLLNANGGLEVSSGGDSIMKASDDRVSIARNLHVGAPSWFEDHLNANGLVTVRSKEHWLIKMNEERVVISGNLRVYGEVHPGATRT